MGTFTHHEACAACGSSDGRAVYEAGDSFCFVCNTYTRAPKAEGEEGERAQVKTLAQGPMVDGEVLPLKARCISQETCSKFRYLVGEDEHGTPVQIATYFDAKGIPCAQKLRYEDKTFRWTGNPRSAVLFGQNLCRDAGKMIVITEGEIDALTMSQVQQNKWPVVSVPNGAAGAVRDLKKHIEWLEGFESIVLMLDNDEAGVKAANDCAALFSPGKAKIASLPLKDANDMLKADRVKDLLNAMWGAKTYQPEGVVSGIELIDRMTEALPEGLGYPWEPMNKLTHGMRLREMVTWTGGTGTGKTQLVGEIAHCLAKTHGQKVGIISLEESVVSAARRQVAIEMGALLHIPEKRALVKNEAIRGAAERVLPWFSFANIDTENWLPRMRFMVKGLGCQWIVLDHISILVSGMATEGDERKRIDELVTKLRRSVDEMNIGLHIVSHLRKTAGTPHEEGGQISLQDLRGSGAIGQLSDFVIGGERDQQAKGEQVNRVALRVLKNRFSGETGLGALLEYNTDTGRIVTAKSQDFDKFFGPGSKGSKRKTAAPRESFPADGDPDF